MLLSYERIIISNLNLHVSLSSWLSQLKGKAMRVKSTRYSEDLVLSFGEFLGFDNMVHVMLSERV